jgi:hypothetical protein
MAPHIPVMAPRPDATPNPKASGRAMKATVIPASVSWAILLPMILMRGQGFMSARNPLILFPRKSIDVWYSYSRIFKGVPKSKEGNWKVMLNCLKLLKEIASLVPSIFSLCLEKIKSKLLILCVFYDEG